MSVPNANVILPAAATEEIDRILDVLYGAVRKRREGFTFSTGRAFVSQKKWVELD